jgi:hypothetical protein
MVAQLDKKFLALYDIRSCVFSVYCSLSADSTLSQINSVHIVRFVFLIYFSRSYVDMQRKMS